MATTISLINMKGGVGKSTLAVNLAWHFAAYANWCKRVLVVDLDPQFNASQYLLGVKEYEKILNTKTPTVWDVLEDGALTPLGKTKLKNAHDPIHSHTKFTSGGRIDLIPSRLELAISLKNSGNKERRLAKLLNAVENEYDLVLIDCAPTESVLTISAYLASQWLLVPVKPEYLSSIGLPLLVNSMNEFNEEYPSHNLGLAGIVFNAASDYLPEERLAKSRVREIAQDNGWHVFETEIEYSRSYPKGAREGQPIFRTSYSRYAKRANFQDFARELAQRVGL